MNNFSAISWREQVTINEMRSALYLTNTLSKLDFYSASSLKQQSESRHVAALGHIILIQMQSFFLLTP